MFNNKCSIINAQYSILNVLLCIRNLESVISAAYHGPAPALDIPELGSTEDPGSCYSKGLFYYIGQVLHILLA